MTRARDIAGGRTGLLDLPFFKSRGCGRKQSCYIVAPWTEIMKDKLGSRLHSPCKQSNRLDCEVLSPAGENMTDCSFVDTTN